MKALVTGGAGFIGSHIAEALCRQGAKVLALDNLVLGNEKNLEWAKGTDLVELVRGDIQDEKLLRKLLPGCDWVFHEAALPSVPMSVAKPIETNQINLQATLQLLTAARDAKVRRFLFASSSAIYGENPTESKHEGLGPEPLSPYALQKYTSERYGQLFHKLYGLETVSLRYFNVFGPRQSFDSPYSGVIAKFCTAMLKGESPLIFGDGKQSRDFVYVQNAASANLLAAQAPAERVAGKTYNIATGKSISLLDLVRDVNELTRQKLVPRFEPARAGDIKHSQADISAAQRDFGFKIIVPWKEGLKQTLDFYR